MIAILIFTAIILTVVLGLLIYIDYLEKQTIKKIDNFIEEVDRFINNERIMIFIEHVKTTAKANDVKLKFIEGDSIFLPESNTHCSGYFIDNPHKELAVAINTNNIEQWLPILVHEFSHMEQCLENSIEWNNNKVNGVESIELIDKWLNGDDSIENIKDLIQMSYTIEADCELRSIENIKKFNLNIDIPTYIQKANSYILFYAAVLQHRKWYEPEKKPYRIKELYSMMPSDKIIIDWELEYPKYKELYQKYCF